LLADHWTRGAAEVLAADACWVKQEYGPYTMWRGFDGKSAFGWHTTSEAVSSANVQIDIAGNDRGFVRQPSDGKEQVYVYPKGKPSYRWVKVPCPDPLRPSDSCGGRKFTSD
jgi:hypothetical protein